MLIKTTVKGKGRGAGNPVLYTPEECAVFAVQYGVSSLNTQEELYWVHKDSIKIEEFSCAVAGDNGVTWTAAAKGTAMVGKTIVNTDEFFAPRPYSFQVLYKSAKDHLGLPDIEVVEMKMGPTESNPSVLMGFEDKTIPEAPPAARFDKLADVGEVIAEAKSGISQKSNRLSK